jgi:hypothetical protein
MTKMQNAMFSFLAKNSNGTPSGSENGNNSPLGEDGQGDGFKGEDN